MIEEEIAAIARHELVAVREEEVASLTDTRSDAAHAAADLLSRLRRPRSRVAAHERDRHPRPTTRRSRQHAEVAARHDVAIFEPEVEEVPARKRGWRWRPGL